MKKIFALLLSVLMLLGLSLAAAEEVEVEQATADFDITMVVPEGYNMTEERLNGNLYISVVPRDEAAASYFISIGYSEEYDGRSISELSEDELEHIASQITTGFQNPERVLNETSGGTLVYTFDETEGESDWGIAVTVYRGYFITVQIERPEYEELSADDLRLAIDLLSGMEFVDNE